LELKDIKAIIDLMKKTDKSFFFIRSMMALMSLSSKVSPG